MHGRHAYAHYTILCLYIQITLIFHTITPKDKTWPSSGSRNFRHSDENGPTFYILREVIFMDLDFIALYLHFYLP